MTGGHGYWIGREADGPDDARKAVREQLKAGADVIKLIATGGVMTPGVEPGASQLTLRRDARGHRGGAPGRAPHRGPRAGIATAIATRWTRASPSIEHGIFLTEEIVARMRRAGPSWSPTLNAPAAIARAASPRGFPTYMVRKSDAVVPAHVASFQLAHRAGVRIAAGARLGHAAEPPRVATLPSSTLMVKYGMTPLEAIRAATVTAAECLGLGEVTGRVAPGYAADLIAVAGDPGRADRGPRGSEDRARERPCHPDRVGDAALSRPARRAARAGPPPRGGPARRTPARPRSPRSRARAAPAAPPAAARD